MTRPTSTRGAPLPTARLSILALWALLALLSAAPAAAEQELEARLPVRVIAGRLLVRCELSTRFRRIPANLFVDIERPCGLELHNRAAHFIKVDEEGGVPITIHLPGRDITVERRGHGDEDLFDQFTRLHSKELGETACIGAIGSEIFAGHKTTLDLNAGLVRLRPPREIGGAPPEEIAVGRQIGAQRQ
ncbi:MAG: hypothetical protein ACE5GW_05920, partial [Planctomycetota bacterium]